MDTDLQRFDLNTLVLQGQQALREHRPGQAARLLREAARRAPFRQDVRDLLAVALQQARRTEEAPPARPGNVLAPARRPEPEPAPAPEPSFEAPSAPEPIPDPPLSPVAPPRPVAPRLPLAQGRGGRAPVPPAPLRMGAPRGTGHAAAYTAPRRGRPVAALVAGMALGLLLMGGVAAGAWYYLNHHGEAAVEREKLERLNAAVARAQELSARGQFALALEAIQALPASPERDAQLARVYSNKGFANLNQRDYPAAIEDFAAGLKARPDDLQMGMLLARSYYLLAMEQRERDRQAAENNLALARQAFEAVLQRDPNHTNVPLNIEALNFLAQIATLQRDPVLQRQSYLEIIKIDPESQAAQQARRNMESLGLRM